MTSGRIREQPSEEHSTVQRMNRSGRKKYAGRSNNDMKMAMKDGQILIREADNVQFTIIKSWGKMKWSRQTQTLSGQADIELLNRLAGLVNLPPSIEAERKKLNEVMAAVDRERMTPKPEPLTPPPVKVSPFTHQVRGYNMALMTFGLVDPPKPREAEK